jgi:hypothetical protein
MKLFEILSWVGMPFRTRTGESFHDKDTPPERTPSGDFIFYHGTTIKRAEKIIAEKRLLHDDMNYCGVGTNPEAVSNYATIKAVKERGKLKRAPSAIVRIVVSQKWFDEHPESVIRETGGSGKNQFLIRTKELPLLDAKIIRKRGTNIK